MGRGRKMSCRYRLLTHASTSESHPDDGEHSDLHRQSAPPNRTTNHPLASLMFFPRTCTRLRPCRTGLLESGETLVETRTFHHSPLPTGDPTSGLLFSNARSTQFFQNRFICGKGIRL